MNILSPDVILSPFFSLQEFARLRFGLGEPKGRTQVEDFLLSPFENQERKQVAAAAHKAVQMVLDRVSPGIANSVLKKRPDIYS